MGRCLLLLLILVSAAAAGDIHGRVFGISDGDTFTLLTADKRQVKIRVAEIDAPESGQPYGKKAKQALSSLRPSLPVPCNDSWTSLNATTKPAKELSPAKIPPQSAKSELIMHAS